MSEPIKDKLIRVIEILTEKISTATQAEEALRYTQAMLNAAQTIRTLEAGN